MAAATVSKAVLVTGCSSGIGHATALHLAGKGWIVYASARRAEAIADLETAGCRTLALDVTDEASMQAAVAAVAAGSAQGAGDSEGPYGAFNAAVASVTKNTYESGPIGKLGGGPETVAKAIERAIRARRPKARYRVTASAKLLIGQRAVMTDRM